MDTTSYTNEKLNSFMTAVNSQIDERVTKLLKEADDESKTILSHAETESMVTAEKHFSESYKKYGNNYARDISKAELEMKKEVLRYRESLTDEIFTVIEDKIKKFTESPKYIDYLVKTLLVSNITENTEIYLCSSDMKYTDTLKKAVKSAGVVFTQDDNIRLGGLSVYNKDKGTITDKTFDLAIEEQKQLFTNSNAFAQ